MRKRWVAALLTVAMTISVVSPLSAYADDGAELFDDDYDYDEQIDDSYALEQAALYDIEEPEDEYGIAVQSATYSMDQLRQMFPAGKYWNNAGMTSNNAYGVTDTPCTDHKKGGVGRDCNYYYRPDGTRWSSQCMGYAQQLAYMYTGVDPITRPRRTDKAAVDTLIPGDVVRYRNNTHSIFITGVNGEDITFTDCNWGNNCIIRWDVHITKSKLKETFTNVRLAPGDRENPVSVDTCSEQYAGWYKVNYNTGISVNSGHNFNSKIGEIPDGALVYVTKASGLGRSQIGHIQYNGQECYLAMNLLQRKSGVEYENAWFGVTEDNKVDDYLNHRIVFKGSVFDWNDLNENIQVRVVSDSGQEVTGVADRAGHNMLDSYTIGTPDQKNQGDYHDFEIAFNNLSVGDHWFRLEAYTQGNWVTLGTTNSVEVNEVYKLLKVAALPDKTEYTVGDTLDTSGLTLKKIYTLNTNFADNLKEDIITDGFDCAPQTLDAVGTQTITVSYDGLTTSFDVTVKEKETPKPDDSTTTPTKPSGDNTTTTKPDNGTTTPTKPSGDNTTTTKPDNSTTTPTKPSGDNTTTTKPDNSTTTPTKPSGDNTTTTKPDNSTTTPTKPSGDNTTTTKPGNTVTTPSDDGSGMAVALLVGGAVVVGGIAIAAMAAMPVEVHATAVSNDRSVIAYAPVALMQGDKVVAETMTDANGGFNFNVQRGDYTLRLTVTDPVTGQTSMRYASISAPANGSVITF